MELFKSLFRRKPEQPKKKKLETLRESVGLLAYKASCEALKADFDAKFSKYNKESSDVIYRRAKRIDRLLLGPFSELFNNGGFGRDDSAASLRAPGAITDTQQLRDFAAQRSQKIMTTLEGYMKDITAVISPRLLDSSQVPLLPLPRFKTSEIGRGADGDSACLLYEKYLEESAGDMMQALSPLVGLKDANAILLPEDLAALHSLYQTFLNDYQFWQYFHETAVIRDPQIIANDAFEARMQIEHLIINGICKPFERTFSLEKRAEADIGIDNYLWGRKDKIGVNFTEPISDAAPEGFKDPKGYFAELGMRSEEISGKKESELKSFLKSHYYTRVKQYYPDANRGEKDALEKMKKINVAYEILSQTEKRNSYLQEYVIS